MSKIFYDHLIVLEEVDIVIRQSTETPEEREELWRLVDEIVHHRVLETVLTHLPEPHHEEYLSMFRDTPHDESLLSYLNDKTSINFEELLAKEIELLQTEILRELKVRK